MALGQGIHDILKYKDIAEAGQPQNLTGEALVQLGALFTQMDFDFKKDDKKEGKRSLTKKEVENRVKLNKALKDQTPEMLKGLESGKVNFEENDLASYEELNKQINTTVKDKKVITEPVITEKDTNLEEKILTTQTQTKNSTLTSDTQGVEGFTLGKLIEDKMVLAAEPGDILYDKDQSIGRKKYNELVANKQLIEDNSDEYNEDGTLKTAQLADINEEVEVSGDKGKVDASSSNAGRPAWADKVNEAFKSLFNSPVKRLQQEHPQILKILQDLRYKQPSEVDSPLFRAAHIASSPFVKTDGVDYRYMKRATMPEYAKGSLGSAAAEGYNLVIDKRNYDQAVKKDYETELDDEMGDLNIEADTINEQTRKDYLELSMNKKKKFNSLFQAYANNEISKLDFENGKAALVSELDAVAGAQTNLTKLRADYIKNKGTYHIDASKPEIVDFYNTLEKNPESFTMKTIDGIDYFIGSTRQGKEVKVPTSKIANGTAGFRLVEKASITPVVASALKAVGTYSEEGMTDYGFGKRSASPEKAKEIGMANIKNALAQDESKLRSFMASIYGVDHETYKNFIGDDPTANREEMLNDAADHLYETQVKPQFFPTQQTSRIDPSKVTFGGKTQRGSVAERNRAANVARLNQMGNITPSNFNNVESEIDLTKYSLVEQEGAYYVTDKKGNVLTQLNLSNQQDTKSKLLNFMKGGGGIGQKSNQTDLSQYNFDI